ncbi:MAG: helix-turn-helix transcriptional regulator [Albidovulum sp.]|nr:helix-turn-helix transcriptional regulator [Albidovulum sp.]
MTIASINPEILKQHRERASLSQQGLADVSKVSKRTIARIEAGKSSANTNSIARLASALGVRPEDLSAQHGSGDRENRLLGFRTIKAPIQETAGLAFQVVEKRYGISTRNQIAMAPLFAALLAEGCLAWRRRKLEEAEKGADTLRDADYGHLLFVIGAARAEEGMDVELESIKERDLFGERVMDYVVEQQWREPDPIDPFTKYLMHLAEQSGAEFIRILPESTEEEDFDKLDQWMTISQFSRSSISYSIDAAELDRLAGGDIWAAKALQRHHARIADIPERMLGDDASEKRIAWLGSKVTQAERKELEDIDAWFNAFAASNDTADKVEI